MTKHDLKEYTWERKKLIELEKHYSELKDEMDCIKSQQISDMPRASSGITSAVEKTVLMLEEAIEKVVEQQEKTMSALVRVENIIAYDNLTSREQLLLRLYYVRGLVWVEVAAEMGLGWSQMHVIHGEALKKIESL